MRVQQHFYHLAPGDARPRRKPPPELHSADVARGFSAKATIVSLGTTALLTNRDFAPPDRPFMSRDGLIMRPERRRRKYGLTPELRMATSSRHPRPGATEKTSRGNEEIGGDRRTITV